MWKLRFRDAKTRVAGDVTTIEGELLDVDQIASLVAPVLVSSEDFITQLRVTIGETLYLELVAGFMESLSPEELTAAWERRKNSE